MLSVFYVGKGVEGVVEMRGYRCKKIEHFKYKRIRNGWLVVNCKTGNHSHFRSEYGCYLAIKFLLNDIEPDNEYLKESCRRLSDRRPHEKKQKYHNKGVRMYV